MNLRRLGLMLGIVVCAAAAIDCGPPDQSILGATPRARRMSPDLSPGREAPAFTAAKMDGQPVNFPSGYKGKVVMLDFWATWCGPCMEEVPNVVRTYNQYHAQGFEILGVSLDDPSDGALVTHTTAQAGMAWPQIYEGNGWDSAVGRQYGIDSIPHAVLVDGDSGKIIADGDALRGANLAILVKRALDNRAKPETAALP